MPRAVFLLLLIMVLIAGGARESHAAKRVALVIGNSAYEHTPSLANPANDAAGVTAALGRLGFEVISERNLTKGGMDNAFRRFARVLDGAEAALFFYAGHGMQFQGVNYLMPVDAKLEHEADLPYEMAQLADVLADMGRVKGVRIAVLDACRNNPLEQKLKLRLASTRGITPSRGFARVKRTEGLLVAFATQTGEVAEDGVRRNSPFTTALLKHIETPGLEVGPLFRRVASAVNRETGGKQTPELSISLLGEFYFAGRQVASRPGPTAAVKPDELAALRRELDALKAQSRPARTGLDTAKQAWEAIADTKSQAVLETFVERFKGTVYGELAKARLKELKVAVGTYPVRSRVEPESEKPPAAAEFPPDSLAPAVSPPKRRTAARGTLRAVKRRGRLICGVSQGLPGWSAPDQNSHWAGLDVDFCRAVSAAIFADPEKIKFYPLTAKEKFSALQSGKVDVLSRNTARNKFRETKLGAYFVGVNYYDGQGFMVPKKLGVKSALKLDRATACVVTGTKTELALANYFRANGMQYYPVSNTISQDAIKAYSAGRCDVLTDNVSRLASLRLGLSTPDNHLILPEHLTKVSLGPWVRQGDTQWLTLLRWSLYAMIKAEELGVNRQNVDAMARNGDKEIKILLGSEGNLGSRLGVGKRWAHNIIKHVGNYGEYFARNVGGNTHLQLSRRLNNLQPNGGLMFAPQLR